MPFFQGATNTDARYSVFNDNTYHAAVHNQRGDGNATFANHGVATTGHTSTAANAGAPVTQSAGNHFLCPDIFPVLIGTLHSGHQAQANYRSAYGQAVGSNNSN